MMLSSALSWARLQHIIQGRGLHPGLCAGMTVGCSSNSLDTTLVGKVSAEGGVYDKEVFMSEVKRWSAERQQAVLPRLLKGDSLYALRRETGADRCSHPLAKVAGRLPRRRG